MNTSGISPLEFNIIVKQDDVGEKTVGGVILPDLTRDKDKYSVTKGVIVAVSPMAFDGDIYPAEMTRPAPGARCMWARHSGHILKGEDGEDYRVLKDKDVMGLIND
uniref:Co-chaperonin GroES n=1 Tax=uncultured virus TaxID=340016 RepID=A0A221S3H3_9VIRU|nr:co-chaperonin GroES [uncultured virus]